MNSDQLVASVKFAEIDPNNSSTLILTISDRKLAVYAAQDYSSLYRKPPAGGGLIPSVGLNNSSSASSSSSSVGGDGTSTSGSVAPDRHLGGDRTISLPIEWLLDNDQKRRHATGQKVSSVFDSYPDLEGMPSMVSVSGPWENKEESRSSNNKRNDTNNKTGEEGAEVEVNKNECLYITLSDKEVVTVTCKDVLLYGCRPGLAATSTTCSTFLIRNPSVESDVRHFDYQQFVSTSKKMDVGPKTKMDGKLTAFSEGLLSLARDGLIIVDNCPLTSPEDTKAVLALARAIDIEQPTLYGTSWTVQTAPTTGPKNNVAYTSEYLDFHHDLVYYQSPPGLQLLHCLKFDQCVTGGESIFLDCFMVAEELRKRDPESFRAFCEIPAAFIKDDMARAEPAQFYYATPHVHLNHVGQIAEMRWAPAFEAPLPVSDISQCKRYYKARASFLKIMAELREKYTLKFRLKPGQCVIFQQTRVLHGREKFTEPVPHSRVLRGCYVNIDAFWNKVAVIVQGKFGAPLTVPKGNRSHL